MSQVLCPKLADESIIITEDNINSLSLSSYERTPGTHVNITCLSNATHRLIGSSTITCLETGQWDAPIPICELIKQNVIEITKSPTQSSGAVIGIVNSASNLTVLPYWIGLGVLAGFSVLLVILLCYSCYLLRRRKRRSEIIFTDTSRSSTPSSELWVDMASSSNFRCHELAQSRNNIVTDYRNPQLFDWSSGTN